MNGGRIVSSRRSLSITLIQAVYSAVLPPSLILLGLLLFYRKNAGAPIDVEGRNLQSPTFWEFARWIIDGGEFS